MQNCSIILEREIENRFKTLIDSFSSTGKCAIFGLIIGYRSESVDYVVHLARCPLPDVVAENEDVTENVQNSAKKAKPKPPVPLALVDEEWILHHVEQAIRMLPGGLFILGLFVIGDKRQILENQAFLSKTLRSIRRLCAQVDGEAFIGDDASTNTPNVKSSNNRMLLLNYDVASKKPSINVIDCIDNRVQSNSVAFSYNKIQWVRINYRAILDFPCFVNLKNNKKSFQKQFLSASSDFFRRFADATMTFNGEFRDSYDVLLEKSGSKKAGAAAAICEYEVRMYIDDSCDLSDLRPNICCVKMHVKGSVFGSFSLPSKCTIGEAANCVKLDILRSVYARVELHNEGMSVVEGEDLEPVVVHQFPRRVLAPLARMDDATDSGNILTVCDYLFEGDTGEDSVQSLKDILDVDVDLASIRDGFETAVDERNLSKFDFSMQRNVGDGADESADGFSNEVNKIEMEKQARLSKWPLIFTVLSFLIGLISYLIYIWMLA